MIVSTSENTTPGIGCSVERRGEMRHRLPACFQLALTFLTGKAYPGQRRLRLTPTFHLLAATTSTALGVFVGVLAMNALGWWLFALPIGWAMTLHGIRNLRMLIYHQCAHRNMWRHRHLDRALARLIAGVLVIQNPERYCREHAADHHGARHMTLHDPTVQAFLVSLGLRPGMTRATMWRKLRGRLLSPKFHGLFAISRFRSLTHGAPWREWIAAVVCYAALLAVAVVSDQWLTILVVWFIPLVPMYQVSNTLRLCVKHTFPATAATDRRGTDYFASLTNAIFLGSPVPPHGLSRMRSVAAWSRWTACMLVMHWPARYLVLTGDTVVHDYHHRKPSSREWADYLFARAADDAAGHPGWPSYREIWGLRNAISTVFDSLSVASPAEFDIARLPQVSKRELFAAFDD